MNQNGWGRLANGAHWGPLRIAFLVYGSDPVTFFSLGAAWSEPDWLRAPRAHDVSPAFRWYPLVTMLQLMADMSAGTGSVPLGFGHNFAPQHYIDAWVALSAPATWSDGDTRRLKALFATYTRPH
jgi:uncharacterized membrane protein